MMNSLNDRLAEAVADSADDGYIIGVVVNNVDPEGLGRVQVSIPQLFDPGQGDLPWVGPTKKSPFGQGATWGVYGSPAINSEVAIRFQNNDPHYGLCEYDLYSKGSANPKFADPHTWGFKDPGGSELFVNYQTGQWEFTHQSGLTLKYDQTGNATENIPGMLSITVTTDTTIKSGGTITLDAPSTETTGNLKSGTGVTVTTTSGTGQTLTFDSGILINCV